MIRTLTVALITFLAASCGSSSAEGDAALTIPYDDERSASAKVEVDQGTSGDDTAVLVSVFPVLDTRDPQPPPEIACALTTDREIDPLVFTTFTYRLRSGRYATEEASVLRLRIPPCGAFATCTARFATSCATVRHDSVADASDIVVQVVVTAENPSLGDGAIRVELN